MTDSNPEASVIIVSFNSGDDLHECLQTVCDQSHDDYEVVLVDNRSEDGSVDVVRNQFPDVRILENDTNRLYGGGNNDGFRSARGEYLVSLNPDVAVETDWLEELLVPFKNDPDGRIGLTTSKIVRYDARNRINACGNIAHYTGLGFCRGLDAPRTAYSEPEDVAAISGCSFAIRRAVYEDIGGFDEMFGLYCEDLDLSWRARLAGYDIVYTPGSVVYHKYRLTAPDWKFFNVERNRLLLLLKHMHYRTLLLLLPGFVMTELIVFAFALRTRQSYVKVKIHTIAWLFQHRSSLHERRSVVQSMRARSDEELLSELDVDLPFTQFGLPSIASTALNTLLRLTYRVSYSMIKTTIGERIFRLTGPQGATEESRTN